MRATLLERDPWVATLLGCACDRVGIPLARVAGLPALLAAAMAARPDDFLILDLTRDGHEDLARYAPVLARPAPAVHLVYRDEALPAALAPDATAPLVWLPAETGWLGLPDKLEALLRQVYGARRAALRRPLGRRQRQVLVLLGEGHTYDRIARQLGIATPSAKEHARRLEHRLGVRSTAELRTIARLGIF